MNLTTLKLKLLNYFRTTNLSGNLTVNLREKSNKLKSRGKMV